EPLEEHRDARIMLGVLVVPGQIVRLLGEGQQFVAPLLPLSLDQIITAARGFGDSPCIKRVPNNGFIYRARRPNAAVLGIGDKSVRYPIISRVGADPVLDVGPIGLV